MAKAEPQVALVTEWKASDHIPSPTELIHLSASPHDCTDAVDGGLPLGRGQINKRIEERQIKESNRIDLEIEEQEPRFSLPTRSLRYSNDNCQQRRHSLGSILTRESLGLLLKYLLWAAVWYAFIYLYFGYFYFFVGRS
jgi:hypothetical protein